MFVFILSICNMHLWRSVEIKESNFTPMLLVIIKSVHFNDTRKNDMAQITSYA